MPPLINSMATASFILAMAGWHPSPLDAIAAWVRADCTRYVERWDLRKSQHGRQLILLEPIVHNGMPLPINRPFLRNAFFGRSAVSGLLYSHFSFLRSQLELVDFLLNCLLRNAFFGRFAAIRTFALAFLQYLQALSSFPSSNRGKLKFFSFSICKVNPLGTLAALTFQN